VTRRLTFLDRMILLLTACLAAYQVAVGINGFGSTAVLWYTIGFGVLLVACLLLIIFGFDILDSPWVVAIAAILPISIAAGLVSEYLSGFEIAYLAFGILGVLLILLSRLLLPIRFSTIVLAFVHGIAGLLIVILPIWITLQGEAGIGFLLVSLGGMIIGVVGLLLSILKAGKPLLPISRILALFPTLLLFMSASFVAGMAWG
jgi:hypothetical protein